jgi:hypothetical protein
MIGAELVVTPTNEAEVSFGIDDELSETFLTGAVEKQRSRVEEGQPEVRLGVDIGCNNKPNRNANHFEAQIKVCMLSLSDPGEEIVASLSVRCLVALAYKQIDRQRPRRLPSVTAPRQCDGHLQCL